MFEFHDGLRRVDAEARTHELLGQVGIRDAARVARCYPHELSGGMRQRVMIAIALALRPQVLVADEPTTALDVTVQADVLALVGELQRQHGVTLVWITHDMGVVAELADDIAVMYGGRIVERGPARDVFASPAHPYTQALLATIGDGRAPAKTAFSAIPGTPPHGPPPPGCPFHPRCAKAFAPCGETRPAPHPGGRRPRVLVSPRGRPDVSQDAVVELVDVRRTYGATRAVDGVSLALPARSERRARG